MWKLMILSSILAAGCSSDTAVDSNEQARRAYLGLDKSVSKGLTLAFQGYDMASNANIPAQMMTGDVRGTIAVTGKVDHGNPTQATMNVDIGLATYGDGPVSIDAKGHTVSITYDTSTDVTQQPVLNLKLNASSGNSLSGTLGGDYTMSGDLKGVVTLDLTIDGMFSGSGTTVQRVPGSTIVTGSAVNASGGMYQINVTL
jgi:hypothetical protein